jgi:hypothetical protein
MSPLSIVITTMYDTATYHNCQLAKFVFIQLPIGNGYLIFFANMQLLIHHQI